MLLLILGIYFRKEYDILYKYHIINMVAKIKKIIWNIIFICESVFKRIFASYYTKKIVQNVEIKTNNENVNHSERIFYIICRKAEAGFFSNYFFVLGHSIIAEENNWIPVVDMKNYKTPYNENYEIRNTLNAWEYYFELNNEISLEGALKSENVIFSCLDYPIEKVPYYSMGIGRYPNEKLVKKLFPYVQKYCRIHEDIKEKFEDEAERYNLEKCIGVHIRGTDMKTAIAHPKPLALPQIMKKIDKVLKNTDKSLNIFLCTDEERIEKEMKEKYGEKLLVSEAYRSKGGNKGIHLEKNMQGIRENHHYLLGLEVLRDAYFLSKCKILISGKSNVPYAAIVMNNNQYFKVIHY